MASDNDYFHDAINIFKFSETGQGKPSLPGRQPPFVNRYKQLAKDVILKLWALYNSNSISFQVTNSDGEVTPPNGPLKVAMKFKSPKKLAYLSSVLAHEATHCCRPSSVSSNYASDELCCRTMECLFYTDLTKKGVPITSKVHGKAVRIKMAQADWAADLKEMYIYFTKHQLIDWVLAIKDYRSELNPNWVESHYIYWGGSKNRWSPTLGYFVRTLAKTPNPSRNNIIKDMMMVASNRGRNAWLKMIREATRTGFPAAKIRTALSGYLVPRKDIQIMKGRIRRWGLATQPNNGLDCLP